MLLPIPGVSVCVPAHNSERFLAEAIRSVLDQTNRDFELVVLDNASRDSTVDIVRSFQADPRVRMERYTAPLPPTETRNRAVQLSRAPLVKVLAPEDLLHPRCLELQAEAMEADPGLAVAAGRQHLIDDESRVIVPRRGMTGLSGVRTGVEVARRIVRSGINPIGGTSGVLFRRDDFFSAGGWRGDRGSVADLDLWMRLLQMGDFVGFDETLAATRLRRAAPGDGEARERRAYIGALADSPTFSIRALDRLAGALGGPAHLMRRSALAMATRRATRT